MGNEKELKNGSPDSSKKPILSVILCARNDRYQGNSTWRLQTALNYLGQSVHQLGREEDVEVIVSDWGSETPLRNVLKLTQEAARIVSFIIIPPDIARVEQKDSPFPEVLALNAAARRARGEYIGRIDQDILVGRHFLQQFFWLHEKPRMIVPLQKAVMLSNRRRIPYRFATLCPSFWAVDRYLRWFGRSLPLSQPPPPLYAYMSYIGILLFHRDLWYQCGGYDEQFIYMDCMEYDIILRLAKQNIFVNLGEIVDYDFFHLDHELPRKPLRFGRNRKTNPARSVENPPESINPNGENWGLTRYPLEVLPYPTDLASKNEDGFVWPGVEWLEFLGALLWSGIQIAVDQAIVGIRNAGAKMIKGVPETGANLAHSLVQIWLLFLAPSTWKNRARVARETVSGRPLLSWPRLLLIRWRKR
jgi:hypothetical protein